MLAVVQIQAVQPALHALLDDRCGLLAPFGTESGNAAGCCGGSMAGLPHRIC